MSTFSPFSSLLHTLSSNAVKRRQSSTTVFFGTAANAPAVKKSNSSALDVESGLSLGAFPVHAG